jgi:Mn-dependent DtxR family transcriptional regulator
LHEKGYVGNPVSKNKSVELTKEGRAKAKELFWKLFGRPS